MGRFGFVVLGQVAAVRAAPQGAAIGAVEAFDPSVIHHTIAAEPFPCVGRVVPALRHQGSRVVAERIDVGNRPAAFGALQRRGTSQRSAEFGPPVVAPPGSEHLVIFESRPPAAVGLAIQLVLRSEHLGVSSAYLGHCGSTIVDLDGHEVGPVDTAGIDLDRGGLAHRFPCGLQTLSIARIAVWSKALGRALRGLRWDGILRNAGRTL